MAERFDEMELIVRNQPSHRNATVLVADDNDSVLEHVIAMLEDDFNVIGAVRNAPAALNEIERLRPEVAILDISLGDASGIDVAKELRARGYEGKIVFLSIHEDPEFVTAAFSAGGTAYVTKPSMANDLAAAIRIVLQDLSFVSDRIRPH
jgi:DNA-binding NarL/FixJ family response regulator